MNVVMQVTCTTETTPQQQFFVISDSSCTPTPSSTPPIEEVSVMTASAQPLLLSQPVASKISTLHLSSACVSSQQLHIPGLMILQVPVSHQMTLPTQRISPRRTLSHIGLLIILTEDLQYH